MALALAYQSNSRTRFSRCLDPLGSVIQIYQNGWPIADACYEPYGGIYTQWNMEGKTFTWLGGWGYRQTGVEWSSVYVRARHYSRGLSNWTSTDPLWPSEMAYGYVEGRVMTGVDPSGQIAIPIACGVACLTAACCAAGVWIACGELWGEEPEFGDCVKDYVQSLPPLSQAGCAVGLAGCLACIGRFIVRAKPKPKPKNTKLAKSAKPDCAKEVAAKQAACKIKHSCKKSDSCESLATKHAAGGACLVAKRKVDRCYKGINYSGKDHPGSQSETIEAVRNCQKLLKDKSCWPWGQK